MSFNLTILGCHSPPPKLNRNNSSQILEINNNLFLIDCAENTQVNLRKYNFGFQKIHSIFISHLHGDHYLGIFGLIFSMHLLGRKKKLNIYAPNKLKELIDLSHKLSYTSLNFQINFIPLNFDEKSTLYEDEKLIISSFPLKHSISCCGFVFKEKIKPRKINRKMTDYYEIPKFELNNLKKGNDYLMENGSTIKNYDLTLNPNKSFSYAYCSDTLFFPKVSEFFDDLDLLYHEATFLDIDKKIAKKTFHSTPKEAARIADITNSKNLLIGHFSSRYKSTNNFLKESKMIFKNSKLAYDGLKIDFSFFLK